MGIEYEHDETMKIGFDFTLSTRSACVSILPVGVGEPLTPTRW
jgi:hypothetical protein